MKSRRSIRVKIMAMLAIPLVVLVGIWLFAVSITMRSALDLRGAGTTSAHVGVPGEAMVSELQSERRLTMLYLADGRRSAQPLAEQRSRTDAAATTFRRESGSAQVRDVARTETRQSIAHTVAALGALATLRVDIDRGGGLDQARQGYNSIITVTYAVLQTLVVHEDAAVTQEANGVLALSLARELLSQEDALLSDFLTDRGFTDADHAELVSVIGQTRLVLPYAVTLLPSATQARYQKMAAGEAFVRLRAVEDRLVAAAPVGGAAGAVEGGPGLDLAGWRAAFDPVNRQLKEFRAAADRANVAHAGRASTLILVRLGLAGLAGLAGVLLSVVLSVRIGRSIARRLDDLREAAVELADDRLPSVVARLRRGEPVDVAREAPPLRLGDDEIGGLGEALNTLRETAVRSAVEEAAMRQGMNEVFLNIARRSQTLLHRQLTVLDGMERRSSQPEDLADLFLVDHLATRMRRHAEDLVILAGAAPGRGWRHPVPLVDVIRGAVSEVEDYARVQVHEVSEAALAGRAVGDVIHLLAELVENATAFSPPHTRVTITGQLVPSGFVVEIEDRGLGMPDSALDEANQRLADPPEFDPAMSSRLGLFVVAQLAARHGVRVYLRASVYGGVTALVMVPAGLVVDQPDVAWGALSAGGVNGVNGVVGGRAGHAPAHSRGAYGAEAIGRTTNGAAAGGAATNGRAFAWLDPRGAAAVEEQLATMPPVFSAPAIAPDAPVSPPVPPLPPIRVPGLFVAEPAPEVAELGGQPERPAARHALPGLPGLPRRVRQSSLAPQLQRSDAAPQPAEQEPPGRSAEQMRSMMSAFQLGSHRGRGDDGDGVAG